MIDIEDLLGEIELTLKMAKKAVFSDAVIVNPEDVYKIIDKIRDNLPDMIREANYVLQNRERQQKEDAQRVQMMMATAEKRAQEIVREAQLKAEKIVATHDLTLQAEKQSESIRGEAKDFSENVKREARDNVISLFEESARTLSKQLNSLLTAIEDIKSMPI